MCVLGANNLWYKNFKSSFSRNILDKYLKVHLFTFYLDNRCTKVRQGAILQKQGY